MTIDQQPTQIGFNRTPILYLVSDPNYIEDSFQYIADVYLWTATEPIPTEPEYELRKPPALKTGTGTFDIRTLTSDYLVRPDYDYNDYDDTDGMFVNVVVKFGYTYIDGTGTQVIVRDLADSNQIITVNGYNYYMDGINYVPLMRLGNATDIPIGSNLYWMTDRPLKMCIPYDTTMYNFMLNFRLGLVTWVWYVADGGLPVGVDLATFNEGLLAFPVGYTDVLDFLSLPSMATWQIYGGDELGNPVTEIYEFEVCEPCVNGFINLQFMNRYGVWDYFIARGTRIDSIEVDRTEILHSPLDVSALNQFDFQSPYGQFHMANVDARESMLVNTGWIDVDVWNEVLKQMMMTEFLHDADTLVPFTINTGSLRFKTSLVASMLDYQFELNYAYTGTNTAG